MGMPIPGDRILIIISFWQDPRRSRERTLEISCTPYRPGRCLLGYSRRALAVAQLGNPVRIAFSELWVSQKSQHRVMTETLLYKRTFGLPILSVLAVRPIPLHCMRRAIRIMKCRVWHFARVPCLCSKHWCGSVLDSHAFSLRSSVAAATFHLAGVALYAGREQLSANEEPDSCSSAALHQRRARI